MNKAIFGNEITMEIDALFKCLGIMNVKEIPSGGTLKAL